MLTNSTVTAEKIDSFKLQKSMRNIAVIDDDPSFQALMRETGRFLDINVSCFSSLSDVPVKRELKQFDVVILDYYLETSNGVDIATYINSFFPNTPVVLISGELLSMDVDEWPPCIQAFMNKKIGVEKILIETLRLIDE